MARHASYEQRIQVHTLRNIGWGYKLIARQLGLTRGQVLYLSRRSAQPAARSGRPLILDSSQRRHVIDFITENAAHRRMAF